MFVRGALDIPAPAWSFLLAHGKRAGLWAFAEPLRCEERGAVNAKEIFSQQSYSGKGTLNQASDGRR